MCHSRTVPSMSLRIIEKYGLELLLSLGKYLVDESLFNCNDLVWMLSEFIWNNWRLGNTLSIVSSERLRWRLSVALNTIWRGRVFILIIILIAHITLNLRNWLLQ